jgi:colicin import membrane protein
MTEQPTTTATCRYPGCQDPPEPASGPGRRPQYCADPGHNALTAYRERKKLPDPEHGTAITDAGTGQPVTMARITGAELLRQMRELAGTLAATADRLTGAMATMTDPTAAEAEVEAARAAAEQRAATAEAGRAEAERRAATADQLRAEADGAAEDMSIRLAAETDRARQARDRLTEAAATQAVEIELIGRQAHERIAAAETYCDTTVLAAETERDAALTEAGQRRREAQQAAQRAAVAEARAKAATAEATRIREDAARELGELRASAAAELDRLRADTARERDELRELLQGQARHLTEARDTQRRRAERAEHDLDAARAELAQLRSTITAAAAASSTPKRPQAGRSAES